MQTRFTHIMNHMRAMGKTFSNDKLVIRVLRCLNHSWQPKVTIICEEGENKNKNSNTQN